MGSWLKFEPSNDGLRGFLVYRSALFIFREHPIFMMYLLVALIAIFKSYPSYADAALYIALLPCWKFVFPCKYNIRFFEMSDIYLIIHELS